MHIKYILAFRIQLEVRPPIIIITKWPRRPITRGHRGCLTGPQLRIGLRLGRIGSRLAFLAEGGALLGGDLGVLVVFGRLVEVHVFAAAFYHWIISISKGHFVNNLPASVIRITLERRDQFLICAIFGLLPIH